MSTIAGQQDLARQRKPETSLTGPIEVHELPDRVRYLLPPHPRRQCVRKLLWIFGLLAMTDFLGGWGIWILVQDACSPETWPVVKVVLIFAVVYLALLALATNLAWRSALWVGFMEILGDRPEVELSQTALRAVQRNHEGVKESVVFPMSQIRGLRVATILLFGEGSSISCETDSGFHRLVWWKNSRPVMIELAQAVGKRLNLPVTVLEPEYPDD
jgi:hypothetical protein